MMNTTHKNWFFLFSSNFLGILNDNFLKHCIVFIGITWAMPQFLTQSLLITLVSAALVVPFIIFSPLAGRLAVIYPKQKVYKWCKLAELPIMITATLAFYFQSVELAIIVVFIMGIQSCLFSPSKYGLIRDIGGEVGLSYGSGMIETMAFLAILAGTVIAPLLSDHYSFWIAVSLFIGIALLGFITSSSIRVIEPPISEEMIREKSTLNPIKFLLESYRFAKRYPNINIGVLGVSIFWLIGGMMQMNLVIHCTRTLQTSNTVAGIVMAMAAIGIALGCTFAGKTSRGKINTNLIFIGLSGMTIALLGIVIFNPPVVVCAILVFIIAFTGGLFEVPCLALVQQADTGRKLGDMLAYMNLVIFIFVLLGSGIFALTTQIYDSSLVVFGVIVGICAGTLWWFLKTVRP